MAPSQYVIQSFIAINKLGWRPQVFVNSISIEPTVMRTATLSASAKLTAGAIGMAWLKDPTNSAGPATAASASTGRS